ncbi:hypothetical protein B23_0564 [Geobacillus thermoleovorans B23]|nr:hypothetical protein B23_0564 [Geobacillus thermoleovorans B23]
MVKLQMASICFEKSHGRRWRQFWTLAEISKK